jgi:hypothetical protein
MDIVAPNRRIRALALALLTLAALAGTACGGHGDGPSGPPSDPSDPSEPGPDQTPDGPAPVGAVMYAVDLSNNFIVFGRGSVETPTAMMRITGLPILKRVIGLAIRKSDRAVIGVGNDSRVYTIDPLTAEATPISDGPFAPQIASFFDIHFAMSVEPDGEHIRLIAAESGGNWSIDINDGSARLDPNATYGEGSDLAGHTPALLGIVYPTLPDSAKQPGWCRNLAYGLDADEAIIVASCDPATGYWFPVGSAPEPGAAARRALSRMQTGMPPKEMILKDLHDQLLRCGEFMAGPVGSHSDGEPGPPQDSGPFFPHYPDTEFYTFLINVADRQNRAHAVKLIDGNEWGLYPGPLLPDDQFVQSTVEAVDSPYKGMKATAGVRLSRVRPPAPSLTEAANDPVAACRGGGK